MDRRAIVFLCLLLAATGAARGGDPIEIEIWCPDVNGDRIVDNDDILAIGAAMGCTLESCSAWDVNRNGIVGDNDFAKAQALLGPCPDRCDANNSGEINIADLVVILEGIVADENDELDCRADLDHSRTIDGIDMYIYWSTFHGSPDALEVDQADVNGDRILNGPDSSSINVQQGAWCGADVNGDGNVDNEDYLMVCYELGYSEEDCGGVPQKSCAALPL